MSYISDYKVSGDYEEYRLNAQRENAIARYEESHDYGDWCGELCDDCDYNENGECQKGYLI